MLKIKKNVDLSILETKYGFKYDDNDKSYYFIELVAESSYTGNRKVTPNNDISVKIKIKRRKVWLEVSIHGHDAACGVTDYIGTLPILFDLIKDGLIEKVEG